MADAAVADITDSDRLAQAHPYYVRREHDYVRTLSDLLEQGDVGTMSLVAYQAGAIGVRALVPQLERLLASPNATVVAAAEQAFAQLTRSEVTLGP